VTATLLIVWLVLAIPAAAIGVLLISWSVLLYPEEERSIAEALAAWWIRINDVGTSATSRNRVLIRDVAAALAHWLDMVFGERLVSGRAIAVSVCLSFSSALAYSGLVAFVDPTPDPVNPKLVVVCLPLSYFLFTVAVGRRRLLLTVVSTILSGGLVLITVAALTVNPAPLNALVFLEVALVAITCDFLVILLARRLASRASSVSVLSALAIATLGLLIGVLMLGTPAIVMYNRGAHFDHWAAIGFFGGMSNLYAGLAAVALGALTFMYLVQRVLWFAIERPLYALDRFGLFQNRKALFYCGVLLIALGFPRIANALLKVIALF
jgi:hypothetical protein